MSERQSLLTPGQLTRLERLRLLCRERPSLRQGGRRSREAGSSLEFAEYRPYMPGDDLRHLDWRAYARLNKLFLKTFYDERDTRLYLLLDVSRSMQYGEKGLQARRLAAALGYVALAGVDRVEAWTFANALLRRTPCLAGKRSTARLFEFLQAEEEEALAGSLDWLVPCSPKEPGIVVILSDMLFDSGYEAALGYLQQCSHQVAVVQVLSREELAPNYAGDLRLIDSESGQGRDVSISPRVLARYRQAVQEYTEHLRQHCARRGFSYALVAADEAVDEVIFRKLIGAGVIGG
jgi:uncharacterized protein (DUF58 family)